jgi:hypothetical protein
MSNQEHNGKVPVSWGFNVTASEVKVAVDEFMLNRNIKGYKGAELKIANDGEVVIYAFFDKNAGRINTGGNRNESKNILPQYLNRLDNSNSSKLDHNFMNSITALSGDNPTVNRWHEAMGVKLDIFRVLMNVVGADFNKEAINITDTQRSITGEITMFVFKTLKSNLGQGSSNSTLNRLMNNVVR